MAASMDSAVQPWLHEEVLDAGAGAVLAELGLLLEDADDGGDDVEGLVLRDEGVDAHGDVGSVERPPPTRRV